MKQLPLVASFILFIALCASAAYWGLQLFRPQARQVTPPPAPPAAEVRIDAVASLFGGRPAAMAVASNYELKGVVMSGTAGESAAILSADGKPADAVVVGREVMPGVTVKEVHPLYVLLSEHGVTKRVELPESARGQSNMLITPPVPTSPGPAPQPQPPEPTQSMFGNPVPAPGQITDSTSALRPVPGRASAPPVMQSSAPMAPGPAPVPSALPGVTTNTLNVPAPSQ